MTIIERLLSVLENKNVKQADICRLLNITSGTFVGWKTRNADPPAKYIALICNYLSISTYWLLTGEEDNEFKIPEQYQELLTQWDKLTERQKGRVEQFIEQLINESAKETNGDNPTLEKAN